MHDKLERDNVELVFFSSKGHYYCIKIELLVCSCFCYCYIFIYVFLFFSHRHFFSSWFFFKEKEDFFGERKGKHSIIFKLKFLFSKKKRKKKHSYYKYCEWYYCVCNYLLQKFSLFFLFIFFWVSHTHSSKISLYFLKCFFIFISNISSLRGQQLFLSCLLVSKRSLLDELLRGADLEELKRSMEKSIICFLRNQHHNYSILSP